MKGVPSDIPLQIFGRGLRRKPIGASPAAIAAELAVIKP
jgi:hypothetical protein